jgi:hypothetical protein
VTNPHSYNANELMNLAGAVEQAPYIKLIHATFDGELSKEAQQMIVTALRALASPSSSGPSREDVIEECAMVAEDEWITTNSLCRSKAAGDIAKAIRALKCSSATQREGEKK